MNQAFLDAIALVKGAKDDISALGGKGQQLETVVAGILQDIADEAWPSVETKITALKTGAEQLLVDVQAVYSTVVAP